MKTILLSIEYDGTFFAGWQRQPAQRSVQSELEKTLSGFCHKPVAVFGASRTDAGVHAYDQKAHFLWDFDFPVEHIPNALNGFLPSDIRIRAAEEVPTDFHARFSCTGKKYIYKIRNTAESDVFSRYYYSRIAKTLDVEAMAEAAAYFEGTHDFKVFSGNNGVIMHNTIRTVHSFSVNKLDNQIIELEVTGSAFLYKMVRLMTGALIHIGHGKRMPESIKSVLAGELKRMGNTAVPQGLYLAKVYYDQKELLNDLKSSSLENSI
jgi:tRNA pseudouridine38-40 synthase